MNKSTTLCNAKSLLYSCYPSTPQRCSTFHSKKAGDATLDIIFQILQGVNKASLLAALLPLQLSWSHNGYFRYDMCTSNGCKVLIAPQASCHSSSQYISLAISKSSLEKQLELTPMAGYIEERWLVPLTLLSTDQRPSKLEPGQHVVMELMIPQIRGLRHESSTHAYPLRRHPISGL